MKAEAITQEVLNVRDLSIQFGRGPGALRAVDELSFSIRAGETLGLVGESGCGKSLTSLALMRLLPEPPARIAGGQIAFGGFDLAAADEKTLRSLRGKELAMIFQEPMTSLNPLMPIGRQIGEALNLHLGLLPDATRRRVMELLELVRMPDAANRAEAFPHELSGGMRQRVMIAMALACEPKLLIADEPTTALDVTVQAQILALLHDLQARLGTAVLLITHDLGVVAETCDRVAVMYAGRKVEEGLVTEVFSNPAHPYTVGLLASNPASGRHEGGRLSSIEGAVPALSDMPAGCRFAPRCPLASDRCRAESPPEEALSATHTAACWNREALR